MAEKKTLVEELGYRYVRDNFTSALFKYKGQIANLAEVGERESAIHILAPGPRGGLKWEVQRIPSSELKDFSTFQYPKLGYRQMKHDKLNNIVARLTAIRNTQRGLKFDLLHVEHLPVIDMMVNAGLSSAWNSATTARRAKEIFEPTFTPFYEGIKQLLDNKISAFAVSEDLAVGLSANTSADRGWDVYFRGRVVGNVDEGGRVTIVNKILQRESIKRNLFK